ncbi:ABC transporter ATP-binding protein [Microlunatus soli]|uniref:ABC-type multidrug transport system, ATPase and permease component n=1 Tax=Microlunatus soli TaxID=630515 RepID=A0A1H1THK3_9ACTN|nr:ABC transporter ATP-binding protein [Microlunatus soli]SDS59777.1 ABC-type multidrug transport system, ATPase and permease component [Microlunatus soli]
MTERGVPVIMPMADSAETWDDERSRRAMGGRQSRVPAELRVPREASVGERLRAWQRRHALRERRARDFYTRSRNPERGLPVAGWPAVADFIKGLLTRRKGLALLLLILNGLAAVAGLIVPRVLGNLVDAAAATGTVAATVNGLAIAVIAIVIMQALLTFGARVSAAIFGQDLLASAREYIVRTVLRLPLSRVESASSGDLVTRVTRDVGTMSESVRWGLPEAVVALITTVLTVVAIVLNSPLLALPILVSVAPLWIAVRRYLQRAPMGYITEGGSYSAINTSLTETVEGARTVESLGLQRHRTDLTDEDIEVSAQAERYTMSLRNLLFGVIDISYNTPLVWTILLGGFGYSQGWVTLGQITAATLYIQAVVEPLDRLISNVDRLQVGVASTTRLLGIAAVPQDREPGDRQPSDSHLVGRDLRFAYREDHDVLHGVDLDLVPGERLAIVGPSGSGKSTLGRLLSGINGPRTGRVTVGDVDLIKLPLDQLRTQVSLVTQEHHVFVGSIRDNIVLAREDSGDDVVVAALRTVDAWDWVQRMPAGLDTMIGSGNNALTPAQAQQIALARLVVADPHTLVLDEATSLIDPRTARHLEGSMAALLEDRTVVAIAHRLHTAHDADRIAVVIDGRIAELGSHQELIDADGEYASLWRAWTS